MKPMEKLEQSTDEQKGQCSWKSCIRNDHIMFLMFTLLISFYGHIYVYIYILILQDIGQIIHVNFIWNSTMNIFPYL